MDGIPIVCGRLVPALPQPQPGRANKQLIELGRGPGDNNVPQPGQSSELSWGWELPQRPMISGWEGLVPCVPDSLTWAWPPW